MPQVEPNIEMQIGTELAQQSVSILNQSSSSIAFYLGENGQEMTRYLINGGIFWYSPNYTEDPIIVVYSPSGRVHYKLSKGSSYKIFWDKRARRWDVREFDQR
ncbi:hypothetical protein MKJ04_20900 [Pontibacter sp. E15-1]|uniref:hypothetical protein n=1 Tax=Pontibacter sp. E15-1 TaxID=2919918 RepID=UPI001F4F767E|nr:hypothetical protein [Pontibacter sp. E15-1]MCJ8167312.1 hypothetical protein [Pontibacter sp. E15-1]